MHESITPQYTIPAGMGCTSHDVTMTIASSSNFTPRDVLAERRARPHRD